MILILTFLNIYFLGSVTFIGESAPLSPLVLHVTATDEITGAKIFTDLKIRPAEEEVPQFELPEYEANITSDAREGACNTYLRK